MMRIVHACEEDLPEILALQRLAFRSEADLLGCGTIPPMVQSLPDLVREFGEGTVLKAVSDESVLAGSVRGFRDGETLRIGKLMVHPGFQGRGLGRRLLAAMEEECPSCRYELFTSVASNRNLELYRSMGYEPFRETDLMPGVRLVYLAKMRNGSPGRG